MIRAKYVDPSLEKGLDPWVLNRGIERRLDVTGTRHVAHESDLAVANRFAA